MRTGKKISMPLQNLAIGFDEWANFQEQFNTYIKQLKNSLNFMQHIEYLYQVGILFRLKTLSNWWMRISDWLYRFEFASYAFWKLKSLLCLLKFSIEWPEKHRNCRHLNSLIKYVKIITSAATQVCAGVLIYKSVDSGSYRAISVYLVVFRFFFF